MAAKYFLINFFLASAIVIVESQVCTKMEPFIEVVTDKYPALTIVTYSDLCQRSNDYYTNYDFGDYPDYETESKYPCTKTRWEMISKTISRQKVTTRLVKYCCDGYRKVYNPNNDNIICEPTANEKSMKAYSYETTPRQTWTIGNDEFNAADTSPEPEFNQTEKEDPEVTIHPINRSWNPNGTTATESAYNPRDPELTEITRQNSTKVPNNFGVKGEDSAKPHDPETILTTRRNFVEITTKPPWYVWMTTHTTIGSIVVQTTAAVTSNSTAPASEISWMGQHWPYILVIVLIILVTVLSVLAWRWTFIRVSLSGKYKVNANNTLNGNPCNKVRRNGETTTVDIPLNRN